MKGLQQFSLEGRVALVTGCRRGLGRACAIALAEAGADIIGVSANMEAEGSEIQKQVATLSRKFWPYTCDLGQREAVYELIRKIELERPLVDILVNNAGTTWRAPASDYPDEAWDRVLEVNLTAPFILAREFGKRMLARGKGKIIFMASISSFQGGITIPSYAASKGGIKQLVMALANEWAAKGVNVNAIAPGYHATDLAEALLKDPARSRAILERIPAGRWGTPDDLKGAVVFLASDASGYVHGTTLSVDGGWLGR